MVVWLKSLNIWIIAGLLFLLLFFFSSFLVLADSPIITVIFQWSPVVSLICSIIALAKILKNNQPGFVFTIPIFIISGWYASFTILPLIAKFICELRNDCIPSF